MAGEGKANPTFGQATPAVQLLLSRDQRAVIVRHTADNPGPAPLTLLAARFCRPTEVGYAATKLEEYSSHGPRSYFGG